MENPEAIRKINSFVIFDIIKGSIRNSYAKNLLDNKISKLSKEVA